MKKWHLKKPLAMNLMTRRAKASFSMKKLGACLAKQVNSNDDDDAGNKALTRHIPVLGQITQLIMGCRS